jgi:hypothetical protein
MTKYVLQSGGMRNNPEGAKRYFAELVKNIGLSPRILLCFFAQPREVWEEKFNPYADAFNSYMPEGIKPTYELSFPDTFAEQVTAADIIYCHGGDDHLAQYWFEKLNATEVWQGKVVGTNSATTHALSTYFWTCDWRELKEGLGVLPIKTIAHYKSSYGKDDPRGPIDWEKAKEELENYGDTSLPVYALPEGEYVVVNE